MTSPDPTTASIVAQNAEREQLRADNQRLREEARVARVEMEHARDESFVAGYEQAIGEIRDHFAKAGDHGTVHVIETTWLGKSAVSLPKPRMP